MDHLSVKYSSTNEGISSSFDDLALHPLAILTCEAVVSCQLECVALTPKYHCIVSVAKPRCSWLNGLKDQKAKARILHRLSQASLGNFGDCEPVGEGVSEMRIHHGPGFRVYFVRHGAAVYVLLCGGDKSSQRRDIARAKRMARELKESGR